MAPSNLLDGKIALITGAASGFGEGIARLFAAEGCKVLLADINDAAGQSVASDINKSGSSAKYVRLNVISADDWRQGLEYAKKQYGGLDILVNNAGWTYTVKNTIEVSETEYDRVFDINVKSIFHSVNVMVPHFLDQGSGNIINIGSCITERATEGLTWYGATKAAVDMITRHLSNEYAPKGIRINGISPSISETPLMREFIGKSPDQESKTALATAVPLRRLCTPNDIAKAALYLSSSYFNDYQTGTILKVDGGLYVCHLPHPMNHMLHAKYIRANIRSAELKGSGKEAQGISVCAT